MGTAPTTGFSSQNPSYPDQPGRNVVRLCALSFVFYIDHVQMKPTEQDPQQAQHTLQAPERNGGPLGAKTNRSRVPTQPAAPKRKPAKAPAETPPEAPRRLSSQESSRGLLRRVQALKSNRRKRTVQKHNVHRAPQQAADAPVPRTGGKPSAGRPRGSGAC